MSTKASMDHPEIGNSNIFDPRRQIPALSYTIQNILMSMAAVVCSTSSLFFTVSIVLPLSILRMLTPKKWLGPSEVAVLADRNKVVLIIGASKGIGNNIMKQYANDANTVIIAVSKSIEATRKAVIELGDATAIIQCAEVDLTAPRKQLMESIRSLDKQYGPITHLYEVSGISNHVKDSATFGLDNIAEMIHVNVAGTVTSVATMFELMKSRGYGKICIVGSVAGIYSPANMICYASTKSFINTFSTSLRVLAAPFGVDVVTVQPGFIDTRMTRQMRGQGSTVPASEFASAAEMAKHMKTAVEKGGVGVVTWPLRQSVVMYGLKALNPICEEVGRWVSMKMGLTGKKIT